MFKIKGISIWVCALFLVFTSCKKEDESDLPTDEVKETTATEDKSNVDTSVDEVSSAVSGIKSSEGVDAFVEFLAVENGEANNEEWADSVFSNLEDLLDFTGLDADDPRFDFDGNLGEYTYNSIDDSWSKVASTKIIFNFPSDENSTTNNGQLALTKYGDTHVVAGDTLGYVPTDIEASLKIDGSTILTMDYNAVWSSDLPTSMNYTLASAPYAMVVSATNNGDKIFNVNYSIKENGITKIGAGASVTMSNSDYDNWTEDDVVSAAIDMTLGDLDVEINIDIAAINEKGEDLTIDELNFYTDGILRFEGEKVADMLMVEDGDDLLMYLVYKDGSQELADDVLVELLEDIEAILEPVAGDVI